MSDNVNAQLEALKMMGGNPDAILKAAGVEPQQQVAEQQVEPDVEQQVVEQEKTVEIDTPLFKMKFGEEVVKDEENLSDINVLSNFAKKYGFDVKSPQDLVKVFEAYQKSEQEKADLRAKAEEAEFIKATLNSLPKEIANPFSAWLNKEDYKSVIKKIASNPLDLNKDFTSYGEVELKKIVDYYYPGKYDEDTWEDLEEPIKDAVKESVSLKYSSDRNEFLNFQAEKEKQILSKRDLFKQSINNSISVLRKNNPDIKDEQIKEIEKEMYGSFNNRLYNEDGTYKENAAEQIAFAVYGKQTLETLQQSLEAKMQRSIKKAVGKANEEIVMRNSDKMPSIQGGDDPNAVSMLVKNATAFLKKKSLFND